MNKYLVVLIVLALLAPFAFASGSGDSSSIEIAVAGPYSGDLAPYGVPTKHAVELVFGGNENIIVNYQDDQCDPSIAANVASNVISTDAVFVIGHICSGATVAALDVYKQTGLGIISPSATSPNLTKSGNYTSLFFRTIAPDDDQGQTQAEFLVNSLGVKTVAIVHDKGTYGKSLAEFTRDELEKRNIPIVVFDGITVGESDYSTVVNKIASVNVDAVMFGGYQPEAAKLLIQLRRRGVTAPFISGDGIKDTAFLQLAGAVAEGVYATGPKDSSGNKLYKEAKQMHVDKYSEEPGAFFYEGYSAALVVKQAIEAVSAKGAVTAQALQDYIIDSKNSFDTPVGKISFNDKGDAVGVGFSVYQVVSGAYQEVIK